MKGLCFALLFVPLALASCNSTPPPPEPQPLTCVVLKDGVVAKGVLSESDTITVKVSDSSAASSAASWKVENGAFVSLPGDPRLTPIKMNPNVERTEESTVFLVGTYAKGSVTCTLKISPNRTALSNLTWQLVAGPAQNGSFPFSVRITNPGPLASQSGMLELSAGEVRSGLLAFSSILPGKTQFLERSLLLQKTGEVEVQARAGKSAADTLVATTTINVPATPGLNVLDVKFTPQSPTSGSELSAVVTLQSTTSGHLALCLQVNSGMCQSLDAAFSKPFTGTTSTVSFQGGVDVPAGAHKVQLRHANTPLDQVNASTYGQLIWEGTLNVQAQAEAELRLNALTFDPTVLQEGAWVEATVSLSNPSSVPYQGYLALLIGDEVLGGAAKPLVVPAGGVVFVTFNTSMLGLTPGEHPVSVRIHTENSVPNLNWGTELATSKVTVQSALPAELNVLSSGDFTPNPVLQNKPLLASFPIRNDGAGPFDGHIALLFRNGDLLPVGEGSCMKLSLRAGEERNVTFQIASVTLDNRGYTHEISVSKDSCPEGEGFESWGEMLYANPNPIAVYGEVPEGVLDFTTIQFVLNPLPAGKNLVVKANLTNFGNATYDGHVAAGLLQEDGSIILLKNQPSSTPVQVLVSESKTMYFAQSTFTPPPGPHTVVVMASTSPLTGSDLSQWTGAQELARGEVTVEGFASVLSMAQDVTFTPNQIQHNSPVQAEFQVKNAGSADYEGYFMLGVRQNGAIQPLADDPENPCQALVVPAGETVSFTVQQSQFQAAEYGRHTWYLRYSTKPCSADLSSWSQENLAIGKVDVVPEVIPAKLTTSSLSLPSLFTSGGNFTASFTLQNSGTEAFGGAITLFVIKPDGSVLTLDSESRHPCRAVYIQGGTSQNQFYEYRQLILPAGEHTVELRINPDESTCPQGPANWGAKLTETTLNVTAPTPGHFSFTRWTYNTVTDGSLTVKVTGLNSGGSPYAAFFAPCLRIDALYCAPIGFESEVTFFNLQPGESTLMFSKVLTSPRGTYTLEFRGSANPPADRRNASGWGTVYATGRLTIP